MEICSHQNASLLSYAPSSVYQELVITFGNANSLDSILELYEPGEDLEISRRAERWEFARVGSRSHIRAPCRFQGRTPMGTRGRSPWKLSEYYILRAQKSSLVTLLMRFYMISYFMKVDLLMAQHRLQ